MSKGRGLNVRLSYAIAAGAFGSAFQHGYNTGVLNAPQDLISIWIKYQNCTDVEEVAEGAAGAVSDGSVSSTPASTDILDSTCAISDGQVTLIWAWIVSIFCVGGMLGGSSVGLISSKLGRKGALMANNVLALLAAGCLFAAKYADAYPLLLVGRFIIGVNSGINAGVAPMYLSEIAPVALRGAVGTVYQLIITISILFSQILGMESVLGNDAGWPFLLGLTIIPGIIQVLTLPLCPESPKYLLLDKDDEARANSALVWLRERVDVHEEMDEMKAEQEAMKLVPKVTLKEMVTTSALRQPLVIAMMMMLAQQLSGINAAMFYSTSIFKSAGLDSHEAQVATLCMGTVNVLMTFVSLVLIEKAGRKTLMIIGLSIMFIATTILMFCLLFQNDLEADPPEPVIYSLAYTSIAMVILFVIGFATGPGSIPWFFVTELFNQSGRPIATSIAVVTNWSANFLVGLGFEPIKHAVGPYVFIIFIVIQILFVVYIFFKVPETKNKTIDEITAKFR